jgi:MFS family permease
VRLGGCAALPRRLAGVLVPGGPHPVDSPAMPDASRSLLRHPDFLKLWTAETVSVFGSQVSALAIPLLAVLTLRVTPFEIALLGTIEMLPFILFTLPAGAWVDRLRRRPIMITGDLGRAIVLATIPLAFALDALTIWQLYVVGFITGTLTVFFDVSNQSYLPSIVERDQLVDANSRLQVSQSAAQIAGPGIAGYLVGILTAPFAILVDAVSFVVSALFVFLIRRPEPPVRHPADVTGEARPSIWSDIRDGLGFVRHHPSLRAIAGGTAMSNLFGSIATATVMLYLADAAYLGLSPTTIGVVFAIGNIGALVGAVTANRMASWLGLGRTIIGTLALGGLGPLFIAIAPAAAPVPFLVVGGLVGGFSQMAYNINQVSYRQAICPPRMLGRMNATIRFLVWGTIPIGSIAGGILATVIGVHQAIWVGAILGLTPALFPLLSPVRHIRVIPSAVADDAEAAGTA